MNARWILGSFLAWSSWACGASDAQPTDGATSRPSGGATAASGTGKGGGSATGGSSTGGMASSGPGSGGMASGGAGSTGSGGVLMPVNCADVEHADLASGQWHEIPNTDFDQACACTNGFPEICGSSYCAGAFSYSGAVFDTLRNRLVTWGGGHLDSFGNELYAFDVSSFQWSRITDPSPPTDGSADCPEVLSDGRPNSRHTYDAMAYLPDADALFVAGGALACGPGDGSVSAWLFHFASATWQQIQPNWVGFSDPVGQIYGYNPLDAAGDYDTVTGRVWLETTFSLSSYHAASNTWQLHIDLWNEVGGRWGERSAVVATQERVMLVIGGGTVIAYDLDAPSNYATWTTTGPQAVVNGGAPGLAYDEASGAVVAWQGGSLHVLDLATRVWSTLPGTVPQGENSVWGRFQYVPCEDAFLGVTSAPEQNVFLYKK